jgi:arylsulfatase
MIPQVRVGFAGGGHVGRLLDGLKKLNILDDTLVYYVIGDNGASAAGA